MPAEYSVTTARALAEAVRRCDLLRPPRTVRYEPGEELHYELKGMAPANRATVRLRVEAFVGGGFAGQVYRVKVLDIDGQPIAGLATGQSCAMKILLPPSRLARKFRDAVFLAGFQGAFSLQVNPAAARAGALWQKLIRRAARVRFGEERVVVDVLGTFVDERLGSCGELCEWVDGRTWRFEADDHLDARRAWSRGRDVPAERLGSPEYRAKKTFMRRFVELLHELGAPELARQYEWWTCKSQPNVLKRRDAEGNPAAGLTAVDFRPGLALLPFLPMSPGDVKLIFQGIARGSVVQFDRGDLEKLRRFMEAHPADFADLGETYEELLRCEEAYRNSLPDITHHHLRLLYDGRLWKGIFDSTVTGWRVSGAADAAVGDRLRKSRVLSLCFALLGLLPGLARLAAAVLVLTCLLSWTASLPMLAAAGVLALIASPLARLLRRVAGREDYRRHYARMLSEKAYLGRAIRARLLETLIAWLRRGRIGARRARRLARQPWRFALHLPLALLPAFLHRMLTDRQYAWEKLKYAFARPVVLYFNPRAREQWLRDMLAEGRRNGMISEADAQRIESRMDEPFIQKYLKSLAVHVCTLPITQVVSVAVSIIYWLHHPELPPQQRAKHVGLILGAFQATPISPGSLVRGLYVLYLVLRERNFKDYNIAVFLGFFKYVGYLAFPIQMAYRYPALARFMAGHWATGAVHIVPVFGERGALLEHAVFDVFYNYPLTVRRKMRQRAERRRSLPSRLWHAGPIAAATLGLMALAEANHIAASGMAPGLKDVLTLALSLPLLTGMLTTRWAGGLTLAKRIALATASGAFAGLASAAANAALGYGPLASLAVIPPLGYLAASAGTALWWAFVFGLLATIGALLSEISIGGDDA